MVTTAQRRDGAQRSLRRPSTLLWVLTGLVIVMLVAGAVAGALRQPSELDAGSPERVVQDYLQGVIDGDTGAARALLSGDTADACSAGDYRAAWVPEGLTASLDGVRIDGDEATVRVRLGTAAGPEPLGGPLVGEQYSSVETFGLAREGDRWRLTGEPWPVLECGGTR